MKLFVPLAALLLLAAYPCLADNGTPADLDPIFQEQQRLLNDMLLEYRREEAEQLERMSSTIRRDQRQSAWDGAMGRSPEEMRRRRDRTEADRFALRQRLNEIRLRTKELDMKKSELKQRVVEKNGQLPPWWDENERRFEAKASAVVRETLRPPQP